MPPVFDVNRFLTSIVRSQTGTAAAKKVLDELQEFSQNDALDPVQKSALQKLFHSLNEPHPTSEGVLSALEVVSFQKPILKEPPSPRIIAALKKKLVIENAFLQERERTSFGKTDQERYEADMELFQFAGLVTIFEYNVSLFLTYRNADQQTRAWMYTSPVIDNLGFTAPGIRAGVENEKTLSTFILRILDEGTRPDLVKAYAEFKDRILKAEPTSDAVTEALAKFISDMLPHFYKRGIIKFSDLFPESYGMTSLNELEPLLT
jgi:hypothetical protein